jgi:hypothetical protein
MRLLPLITLFGLLAGCAGSPPKPPKCEGEFQPVNIQQLQQGAQAMTRKQSLILCQKGGSYVG